MYISGLGPNANGTWQDVMGVEGVPPGTVIDDPGIVSSIVGSGGAPIPVETSFSGVSDAGGGGSDALLMLLDTDRTEQVAIDIKPQSCPNPLNVKVKGSNLISSAGRGPASGMNGVLPVAILGTADFDVTEIDISSVVLEGIAPIRSNTEDVAAPMPDDAGECECTTAGPDSHLDLTLKFLRSEIAATLGPVGDGDEIPLTLTGNLLDGTPIEGSDCVIIRAKRDSPLSPSLLAAGSQSGLSVSNHPNPFNASTVISYTSETEGQVRLEVFDVLGRRLATLVDEFQSVGSHSLTWDAANDRGQRVASGMYFYRLTVGDIVETRKMVLMK
jgi:hypothetical protein